MWLLVHNMKAKTYLQHTVNSSQWNHLPPLPHPRMHADSFSCLHVNYQHLAFSGSLKERRDGCPFSMCHLLLPAFTKLSLSFHFQHSDKVDSAAQIIWSLMLTHKKLTSETVTTGLLSEYTSCYFRSTTNTLTCQISKLQLWRKAHL